MFSIRAPPMGWRPTRAALGEGQLLNHLDQACPRRQAFHLVQNISSRVRFEIWSYSARIRRAGTDPLNSVFLAASLKDPTRTKVTESASLLPGWQVC